MTPQEKAKQLVDKYAPMMYCYLGSGYDERVTQRNAKASALIVINEILNLEVWQHELISGGEDYWQQVKQEIINL